MPPGSLARRAIEGSDGEGVILTAAAMTSHPPESQSVFATRHASSVLIYF